MRTDAERLELVLKFVNGPDVEEANQRELRENLASFLGYPLLADDQIVPDLADRWPDTIGGSNFEISAQIDLSATSLHINVGELPVAKGPAAREGLSGFIGFGPEAVAVPVGVIRKLQNRARRLIYDYHGDREADEARHATWIERGTGTKEQRAVGERKLPKDTIFYINELAERLGGTITAVGRGADIRTHISADPEVAFLWIVLLLINAEPNIRVCEKSDCSNFFVGARRWKRYCADRCGQAVRDTRQYAKPEKRAKTIDYMRAKRAREKAAAGS